MEIVECMYPMHILCKIFGLAFYSVSKKGGRTKIQRCCWIYEVVFVLNYLFKLSSTANHLVNLIERHYNSDSSVVLRYTVMFEAFAAFSMNFILFVLSYFNKTKHIRIWADVVELGGNLKDLKCPVKYRFVKVTTYVIMLGQILILLAFASEVFLVPSEKMLQAALFYEWQFLRMAFRLQLVVWFVLFRQIFVALKVKFGDVLGDNDGGGEIPKLREVHEGACRLMRRINALFSEQILFNIGLDFGIITILSYYTYATMIHKDESDERYVYLLWALFYTCDLLILTTVSCICSTDANNIVIRNLCAIPEDGNQIQQIRKKETHVFILQLLHNEISITASGFFKIDGTLVFAVASALTTYLVILIQFDQNLVSP